MRMKKVKTNRTQNLRLILLYNLWRQGAVMKSCNRMKKQTTSQRLHQSTEILIKYMIKTMRKIYGLELTIKNNKKNRSRKYWQLNKKLMRVTLMMSYMLPWQKHIRLKMIFTSQMRQLTTRNINRLSNSHLFYKNKVVSLPCLGPYKRRKMERNH